MENLKLEKRKLEVEGKAKKDTDTFSSKVVSKMIENIQVTITNIHFRYEDDRGYIPFTAGLTLEEVIARSTDGEFTNNLYNERDSVVHKV